jgi:hypothetical protein
MERDDTLEGVFKLVDEQTSATIQSIDEKLKEHLSRNEKAFLEIIQGMLRNQQASNRWEYKLTKQVDVSYEQFVGIHRTLSQIIDALIELSDLKPELQKLRTELEEQKPTVDNIKKAFEQKKKWLNENK